MPAVRASSLTTSTVTINVYDGTRQPFAVGKNILYTIIDGNQKQWVRKEVATPSLKATGLPFFDNFGDNYCVLAYADGFQQAGFVPVKLSPRTPVTVDLMLIPKEPQFNFADALVGCDQGGSAIPRRRRG